MSRLKPTVALAAAVVCLSMGLATGQDVVVRKKSDETPPAPRPSTAIDPSYREPSRAESLLEQMARQERAEHAARARLQADEHRRIEAARRASHAWQKQYDSPAAREERRRAVAERAASSERKAAELQRKLAEQPRVGGFGEADAPISPAQASATSDAPAPNWPDPHAFFDQAVVSGRFNDFVDWDEHGYRFRADATTVVRIPNDDGPAVAYARGSTKPTHVWDGRRWVDRSLPQGWFFSERTLTTLIEQRGRFFELTSDRLVELTHWQFVCRRVAREFLQSMADEPFEYTFKMLAATQQAANYYVRVLCETNPPGRFAVEIADRLDESRRMFNANSEEERLEILRRAVDIRRPGEIESRGLKRSSLPPRK